MEWIVETVIIRDAWEGRFKMRFYDNFYRYARQTRLYVNEWTRKEIGRDIWKELLKEFVGQLTIDRTRGSSLNSIWEELVGIFPYLFSIETANEADQLLEFFRVYREARKERKQDRHER